MTSPVLNYDVLLDIIAHSDSHRTGLAITSTCQVLRQEGVKILLRRQVKLETEKQLTSFLVFLLKEPTNPVRPHRVQELTLDMYDLSYKLAKLLGLVCPLLTGLKSLELFNAEPLIDSHPDLINSLAKLSSLNCLKIRWAGPAVISLLQLLHAPLRSLSVDWLPDATDHFWEITHDTSWARLHPTILLENFAESLEELTCVWWWMTDVYIPPRKTYPNMRRLVIIDVCDYRRLVLALFIHAFPNLTHLYVDSHQDDDSLFQDDSIVDTFKGNHALNVVEQIFSIAEIAEGPARWQHMQEFAGSFVDLYILGLACRVERLILEDSSNAQYLPFLAEVLSCTCPSYLDYTTFLSASFDGLGFLSTGLLQAGPSARSSLKSLVIRLDLRYSKPNATFHGAMDTLASAVHGTNLHDVRITSTVSIPEACDISAFATNLINAMPTLQEVSFSTPENPKYLWQNVRVTMFGRDGLRSCNVVEGSVHQDALRWAPGQ